MKNLIIDQFAKAIKYSGVGVINTLATIIIMYILAKFGVNYVVYTAISYIVGMIVSFYLNLFVTFKASGYITQRLMRFLIINLINLSIVEVIQIVLIEYFHWQPVFAIAIGMIWYIIFGFIMNQLYAFHKMNYEKNYTLR